MRITATLAATVGLLLPLPGWAFECPTAAVDVCFRPGPERCAEQIAEAVGRAERTVLIQAYGFTSLPIAKAVTGARRRGIDIRAVLDKSNRTTKYSAADFISHAGIPVRIDDDVAIAHNKVIVIDDNLVVTGSYNFTRSAEERNAENVVFIRDQCTAKLFIENFEERWRMAEPYLARGAAEQQPTSPRSGRP
jgi:phosphatidylserine/phosphatidylglycerophosphate/cardiolipin synthase-like enzyme